MTSRIVAILEAVAADPAGRSLAALVELLDAPRSSVHQLLQGLVSVGYVSLDSGRYVPGPALSALAGRPGLALPAGALRRGLRQLADITGETVLFGVFAGLEVIYVAQVESPELIRYVAPLHQRKPLVHTAMGKAMLAALPMPEVRRLLAGQVAGPRFDQDLYLKELEQARLEGVGFNRGGTVAGVFAVGACVRRAGGPVIGGVSVVGPETRMASRMEAHAAAVAAAARRLPADLSTSGVESVTH